MTASKSPHSPQRRRFTVTGAVQGVGFRPHVYRLAREAGLVGWVNNTPQGVVIEVEGSAPGIDSFRSRLQGEKPANSVIDSVQEASATPRGETAFNIVNSETHENVSVSILPDLSLCDACKDEIGDPAARRYRYPFTNCTHCGPRYTIINALPYDRPSTTMAGFTMCADCKAEYEDPMDRRFHAQPIACPACGPQLELLDATGAPLASGDEALFRAAQAVSDDKIVALKGLGGFHLVADARKDAVARLLRERKQRPAKPFAVMYPTLAAARKDCDISEEEARLLGSPQSPIVLARKKAGARITPSVAPENPFLGVMLPYTPLHSLLLDALGFPVIATSGNKGNEPICTGNGEALEKLRGIADVFLMHNRPIARRADDSIVRLVAGRVAILRRARGYAPLPLPLIKSAEAPVMAAGGHFKNTVALAVRDKLVVSPHVGDLDSLEALASHSAARNDLARLYRVTPQVIAHDLHPGYASTRMAQETGITTFPVQHHYAHALACMADNKIEGECLAIVWDGTGYGEDGTIWGGECLKVTHDGFERRYSFLPFRLPGGDMAAREPRRAALGVLHRLEAFEEVATLPFSEEEKAVLRQMLDKNVNSSATSSVGRLFDAVASLLGLAHVNTFEGEAAMALEFAAMESVGVVDSYSFDMRDGVVDWRPSLRGILSDKRAGLPVPTIAARFHETLSDAICAMAKREAENRVLLTGGCFQNKILLESAVAKLEKNGFTPFWHRDLPPNDGGIAAGQVMAVLRRR